MKGRGGRQNAPPTNHTILQKYDFFASLRAACADFQAPRRRVARKKPCERRFSTTFGEKWTAFGGKSTGFERKSTTFAAEAYFQNRSATNHSFFHRCKSVFADALFCIQPVAGGLFPVVLSNRLGMRRPKDEAMCRLTEKKRSRVCSLDGKWYFCARIPSPSCVQAGKKGEDEVRDRTLFVRPFLFGQEKTKQNEHHRRLRAAGK